MLVLASVLGREFALDALARVGGVSEDELLDDARRGDGRPRRLRRSRRARVVFASRTSSSATRSTRGSRPRAASGCTGWRSRRSRRSTATSRDRTSPSSRTTAIAGQRLRARARLRAARRRSRARAPRLRGGGAPVRDGARGARPRGAVPTRRRAASSCSRSARQRHGRGTPRRRRRPSSRPPAIARRLGLPRELARAAAGYGGRIMWARAGDDDRLVPLLEEGLAALADEDVELRARLLARLAGALRDEPSRDRRDALSGEAVELARRTGNPAALAYALDGRVAAIIAPDTVAECLALGSELCERGRADRRPRAARARLTCTGSSAQLMVGDIVRRGGRSRRGEPHRRRAQTARAASGRSAPPGDARAGSGQARRGRGAHRRSPRARRARAADDGDPGLPASAVHALRLPGTPRGGRAGDPRPGRRLPGPPRLPLRARPSPGAARNRTEAKRALDELAADDFSALPFDQEWLYGMSLLAETSALLGDTRLGRRPLPAASPWAALNAADMAEGIRGRSPATSASSPRRQRAGTRPAGTSRTRSP